MFFVCAAAAGWLVAPAASQAAPPTPLLIEGTVCDLKGKPVADANVRLDELNKPIALTRSDSSGHFRLTIEHSGPYTLEAEKSGVRSVTRAVPPAHAGATEHAGPEQTSPVHIDLVLDPMATGGAPSSSSPMEFADQPNFTVAGVTDWTAAGGHGSDASLRTSEALARETLTLKPQGSAPAPHSPNTGDRAALEQERDSVRKLLTEKGSADLHRRLGEIDEKLGDPLGAVHEYEQAAGLDPSEQNYFEWGSELLLHRAVWQAAEVFANGAKGYPNSARLLTALGAALFAGARYDEAAQRLCEASDLAPAAPEPYLFLGKIEIAAPSPLPCAEEKLARFASLQPNDALASYFYAMALWKRQSTPPNLKDMQQVEALLNNAVKVDRKCAGAYLQLGLLHFSLGDYHKAVDYYTQAIGADPQLGEAHYRLGVAYDRLGEAGRAAQEFHLHDQIEKAQAEQVERQRREVKQFLVVLQSRPASPPGH
jgi:tetratricopeptide (TPR) repeat protein